MGLRFNTDWVGQWTRKLNYGGVNFSNTPQFLMYFREIELLPLIKKSWNDLQPGDLYTVILCKRFDKRIDNDWFFDKPKPSPNMLSPFPPAPWRWCAAIQRLNRKYRRDIPRLGETDVTLTRFQVPKNAASCIRKRTTVKSWINFTPVGFNITTYIHLYSFYSNRLYYKQVNVYIAYWICITMHTN